MSVSTQVLLLKDLERLPPGFKAATADIAAGISAAGETAGAVAGEAYKRYAPEALQEFVSESYEASDIKRGVEKIGELAQAYPEEATTAEIAPEHQEPLGPRTPTPSRFPAFQDPSVYAKSHQQKLQKRVWKKNVKPLQTAYYLRTTFKHREL